MHCSRLLIFAAVFASLPGLAKSDIVVAHFETLQRIQVSETGKGLQSFSAKPQAGAAITLDFAALGRQFTMQLEHNDRVAAGLAQGGESQRIQVYRGVLPEYPQSWARIVMFDGMPSGVFSDGRELFAIEAPQDSSLPIDRPAIFRLADAHIAPGTMSCAANDLSGRASTVNKVLSHAASAAMARGPGALSEITLSAIGDFQFTDQRGGDVAAAAAIATRMNNVDGYFSEQVGVQITLQQPVETHSDSDDPFSDTPDSDLLLDELSEYRLQTASHNSAGLTHLWTGRDLAGSTVGIAWRGALCDDYFSAGLTEGKGGALIDSLVAAHEIGHNFGAQHDGEPDTSCADVTGDFIMSASVSSSQEFSECSIAVMQQEASGASCVTALPTVDVGIAAVSNPDLLLAIASDLQFEVSSNGTLDATGVQASFVVPVNLAIDNIAASVGTCSSGAGLASCELGTLAGLSSETVTLTVTPVAIGGGAVAAAVSTSGNDERSANNQEAFGYTVVAPVDLVAGVPAPADVVVGSRTTVSADIDNVSSVDATDLTAEIVLENGIAAVSASWSIGTCTVTPQQVSCQANSLGGMATSTLTVTVDAIARGNRDVTLTLASAEPDATPLDNAVTAAVAVLGEQQNSEDSGGGSSGALLLLFGLVSVWLARRRPDTAHGTVPN